MEAHKILIVEDENIVALDMSRRLTKLGYNVIGTAASGKRALELVDKRGPNIVLMDIHIKGAQDGIEVAQDISLLYRIPVIFLTAYSEDTTLNRARESEPYGYLLKPFSERELHVAIQVALDKHQFIEDLARREAHLKLAVNAARLSTWEANTEDESIVMGYSADRELKELSWARFANNAPDDMRAFMYAMNDVFKKCLLAPVPVIAAINGHAFGNGAILSCACDFRFMKSDRGFFCFPEVDVSIPFLPGMIAFVKKAIPYYKFNEMKLTGKRVAAPELAEHHIIEKACADREALMVDALAFAATFNKKRSIFGEHKRRLHGHIIEIIDKEDPVYIEPLNLMV